MLILQGIGAGRRVILQGFGGLSEPSAVLYKKLADDYASIRELLLSAATDLQGVAPIILSEHSIVPDIDLLETFYVTGNVISGQLSDLRRFESVVRTVSDWALKDSGAATIDDMITEGRFTVRQAWADMSAQVGHPISSDNISG